MKNQDILKNAVESTWLYDSLTPEERMSAAITSVIAVQLQKCRKEHSLTQDDLAKKLGISHEDIIRWEDGDQDFTKENLIKIALTLNLQLSTFFAVFDTVLS